MTSIARSGAGPSGAPLRLLYGGKGARKVVEIAGWLYPGGAKAQAPIAEDPRWRTTAGRAHSLGELLAGQSEGVRGRLVSAHAEAIAAIVRAAAAVKAAGGSPRALIAAAMRLCRELIGQA
ncbi:MAG: hypothetical protein GEU88_19330 [Solirubrobacterales bacterium]|nr:hypothetical protein [Solirubrobacterales bacterium]